MAGRNRVTEGQALRRLVSTSAAGSPPAMRPRAASAGSADISRDGIQPLVEIAIIDSIRPAVAFDKASITEQLGSRSTRPYQRSKRVTLRAA
jgi:hypothetical protein